MAQRDEFASAFRRHDAREPRYLQDIPLFDALFGDELERLRFGSHMSPRDSDSQRFLFLTDVYHPRVAFFVKMCQFIHLIIRS